MQYEHFSRYLREKYSTRLHMPDQLVDQLKQKNSSNLKVAKPYFDECILAAERMKNNRRSERDRQICYENLLLAQKLERIKTPSKKNLEKDCCQLLLSKAINKRKQSVLPNETEIISYHSPSLSDASSSSSQATAADVDASIEYYQHVVPLVKSPPARHFSVCILPRFDDDRPRAFKREILYK